MTAFVLIVSVIILCVFKLTVDVVKDMIHLKKSKDYSKQKQLFKDKIKRPFD